MDRIEVYPSEQPTDTIFLTAERQKMVALGYLAQGVLGTDIVADGFGCIPSVPASLAIQILPGSIYQQEPVDSVQYGSLSVLTTEQIIKQGILHESASLTLTPPSTAGQAINYLIQASFLESDDANMTLPYFNSVPPNVPLTGPGGSGTSQPTIRFGAVSLVAKSGVAATAGTQVTPAPDAGYVGLWAITVANGAMALTSSQISLYPTAPFIAWKLPSIPTQVQGGTWAWGTDTGTANQIIVTMTPTPVNIQAGFEIRVKKMASPSTAGVTIIVNGASPVAVTNADGSALTSTTPMAGGYLARLVFDSTSFRWTNSAASTAVGSLGASSGEGINVTGGGVVSLNYPSLSVETTLGNTDLWSFFSQADTHHRVLSWAQLLAFIRVGLSPSFLNLQLFTTVGTATYTPTVGAKTALIFVVGGGGGGGGGGFTTVLVNAAGGGGEGGYTAILILPLLGVSSVAVTIGDGGIGGTGPSVNGSNGGSSIFGSYAKGIGGAGGNGAARAPAGVGGNGDVAVGTVFLPGGPGTSGTGGGKYDRGGTGGGTFLGHGGAGSYYNNTLNRAATPGSNYGGGGGGGSTPYPVAAAGASGMVLVLEFS